MNGRTLLAAIAALAAVLSAAATATSLATSAALATARPAAPRSSTRATAAATPAASCAEPNCDVSYHGGPVIRAPHVYLYFWGPKWKSAAVEKGAMNYLTGFYKGLGAAPDA